MSIRAVIFDLDGTLLNTIEGISVAMNSTLAKNGFSTLNREQVRKLIGGGAREFMRNALPESERTDAKTDGFYSEYRQCYLESASNLTTVYDGIYELLKALKESGLKLGVFSNKSHPATVRLIEKFFPSTFDVVRGKIDGASPKPDRDSCLSVLSELSEQAESTLMVGDGEPDFQAAQNVGMQYAGALWGYRTEQELRSIGARDFVKSPSELLSVILKRKG